ncbi:MAG: hypothetical protein HYZ50_20140 [Deltaproteobacteria bacterium]|nr:hypothetical protein [Deltaproteobacteria bacterium]
MNSQSFFSPATVVAAGCFFFSPLLIWAWKRVAHLRALGVLALLAVVLTTSGCSVALKPQPLASPAQTYTDRIAASPRAEGIDGKVGWGRFTVFYIPLVPVYIQGDGNTQIMAQVLGALQQVGYQVEPTDDAGAAATTPTLKVKVEKFWFNNYTWFFPIVPTWGEVRLTVSLSSRNGNTLWSRDFSGDGSTYNFTDGYSIAANESMKKILDAMVQEFSSEGFHRALSQT